MDETIMLQKMHTYFPIIPKIILLILANFVAALDFKYFSVNYLLYYILI